MAVGLQCLDWCAIPRLALAISRTVGRLHRCLMADKGKLRQGDGQPSVDSVEEDRSWSRDVQGVPRVSWTSHKLTEEEIDKLQGYFSRVLKLPRSVME